MFKKYHLGACKETLTHFCNDNQNDGVMKVKFNNLKKCTFNKKSKLKDIRQLEIAVQTLSNVLKRLLVVSWVHKVKYLKLLWELL